MNDDRTLGEAIREVLASGLREIRISGIWWNWAWSEERSAYWPRDREPYDPGAVDLEAVRRVLRAIADGPMGWGPADPYGEWEFYDGRLRIDLVGRSGWATIRMTPPEHLPKGDEWREMMMGLRPEGCPAPPGTQGWGKLPPDFVPAPIPGVGGNAPEAPPDRAARGGDPVPPGEPPLPSIAETMQRLREERGQGDEHV